MKLKRNKKKKKKEKRNKKLDEEYNLLVRNFNVLKEKITKYINSFKKWFSKDYKTKQEALNEYNKNVKTPEEELKKSAELTDNQKAIQEYLNKQNELKSEKVKKSSSVKPKFKK